MAHSDIVSSLKEKVIYELSHDDAFFAAIDPNPSKIENGGDLINTHIFRFNKNPNTVTDATTFITIEVNTEYKNKNKAFITPTLIIWIYSHHEHMVIKNIVGINDNRNDYLSKLIDLKFNNTSEGIGKLLLTSNVEGAYNENFLFRRLIFETIDINVSMCKRGDKL